MNNLDMMGSTEGHMPLSKALKGFPAPDELRVRRAKTGLRLFMAVISSLFFLLIISFMIRSQLSDWQHLSAPWRPFENPWQLWVNTFMLVLSSVFLQWSALAAKKTNARRAIETLLLAGIFALAFLGGQVWVWQQLVSLGYGAESNPANSFFFLLTGLHGLHLLGGIVACWKAFSQAWSGPSTEEYVAIIELCAMYWHFLLGLWCVLLALLTSSPENFAAFARLCGF